MQIKITSAVETGPTTLAAFDAAPRKAGIEDYNLIPLSSVITASAVIERTSYSAPPSEYGHRPYVVMARHETSELGEEAWAGLGWAQEPESGRGLFVELHGTSKRCVDGAIDSTLEAMKQARAWVKAGALYALERDYEDLGAQCAEMATKVRNGRRASSLPPTMPRKVVYTLNLKTAEHLKLRLPEELVAGAAKVFR